jgi:hypothetical protein
MLLGAVNKINELFYSPFFDMLLRGADRVALAALMAVTLAVVMIVLLATAALATAWSVRLISDAAAMMACAQQFAPVHPRALRGRTPWGLDSSVGGRREGCVM